MPRDPEISIDPGDYLREAKRHVEAIQTFFREYADWRDCVSTAKRRLLVWEEVITTQLYLDNVLAILLDGGPESWRELPPVVSRRRPIARP